MTDNRERERCWQDNAGDDNLVAVKIVNSCKLGKYLSNFINTLNRGYKTNQ